MPKHIRVENNEVVECVDLMNELPPTGDWRIAIDVDPQVIPNRQIRGSHLFDLSKTPAEIIWEVIDLTIDERKKQLLMNLEGDTKVSIYEYIGTEDYDEIEASEFIVQKLLLKQQNKAIINNLQTHEQIDDYIANNP
jgi:hypothetical protein